MSEQISSLDDLLLTDEEKENKKISQPEKEKVKLTFSGGGIDIDKMPETDRINISNDNIKIIEGEKKIENESNIEPVVNFNNFNNTNNKNNEENNNNVNKNTNFANFVLFNKGNISQNQYMNVNPINQVQSNINDVQSNINSINNSNNLIIPKKIDQVPSSILSNQTIEKKSKISTNKNIDSFSKSQLQKQTTSENKNIYANTQKNEPEILNLRSVYENQIAKYKEKKDEIVTKYSRVIREKNNQYKEIYEENRQEVDELEERCQNKILMQENYLKEAEKKYYEQKEKIEVEKTKIINKLKENYENDLNEKLDLMDQEFKTEKENIINLHNADMAKIDLELKKIKERKVNFINEGNSSRRVEDLNEEIRLKIKEDKNDQKLKLELRGKELLKQKYEERKKELEENIIKVREKIEIYKNEIIRHNTEVENICYKLENEKNELKKKENELINNKLDSEKRFKQKLLDFKTNQKYFEDKTGEENDLQNLEEELDIKFKSILNEKKMFETEKMNIMKLLEERNKELDEKDQKVKEEELEIERELNQILAEEKVINSQLNEIKYLEESNLNERNYIEKERKNLELMEKNIQEDINILNKDKAIIEEDKEKMRNIHFEMEQQNKELNNEFQILKRESIGLELKNNAFENMRLNQVFNNQYANEQNENFDSIGYKSSPNFGKYQNLNKYNNFEKNNENFGIDGEENNMNTISIFNQGGKRISAEDYFKKINDTLKEERKRNIDPNEDMENFLMNGKNYVKDIKEKINGLEKEN